jgi:hypothetical protein
MSNSTCGVALFTAISFISLFSTDKKVKKTESRLYVSLYLSHAPPRPFSSFSSFLPCLFFLFLILFSLAFSSSFPTKDGNAVEMRWVDRSTLMAALRARRVRPSRVREEENGG